MTERRYREDEVRQIFELATTERRTGAPAPSMGDGLTLADIQSIGSEVGIAPDELASAAATLDRPVPQPARKSFGLPIEVGHIVPLPRAITDLEWEQLVAELRSTFKARGKISVHGGLREWTNGNLHAFIEPTEAGYRLRIGTLKGSAQSLNIMGVTGIVASSALLASVVLSGPVGVDALLGPVMLGAAGIGAVISNFVRVPAWARERDEQMKHIAARLRSIMGL